MSFFEELRRRNVFRVGAAYAVVAWLLIQVADVLLPRLGAPEWFVNALMLVILLGFPVALVISWLFEVTPDGITKQDAVDAGAKTTSGKKLNTVIIAALVLAVIFMAVDNYVLDDGVPVSEAITSVDAVQADEILETANLEKSIGVLPFTNLSSDPEQEYFSDGLTDELINKLSQVRDLDVTGRSSSFYFKDRDDALADIGRQLGVAYLLQGSVRKAGSQVRITAQLMDVASNTNLWSDTFDETLDDIFNIQDEIAASVAQALSITLRAGMFSDPGMTGNVEAYDAYLQGIKLYGDTLNGEGSFLDAMAQLEKAVALDPDQDYFADGLAEELLNRLARLQDLLVARRTSSFYFKDRNESMAEIGRQLGVAHILEGSVRKAGNEVRVSAQLLRADNGFQLWSDTYDRNLEDIFSIQDEIAEAVTTALSVTLAAGEFNRPGMTTNVQAYEAYLRADPDLNPVPEETLESIAYLENAVAIDPNFGIAWNALYRAYESANISLPPELSAEFVNLAAPARERAQALMPESAEVLVSNAVFQRRMGNFIDAEELFLAAITRYGNSDAEANLNYGEMLWSVGRINDALPYLQRARRLDPKQADIAIRLATTLLALEQFEEARAETLRGIAANPGNGFMASTMGLVEFAEGNFQIIRQQLETASDQAAGNPGQISSSAMKKYLVDGDPAGAIQILREYAGNNTFSPIIATMIGPTAAIVGDNELALSIHTNTSSSNGVDVFGSYSIWQNYLSGMRQLEGFKDLAADAGLVTYWRTTGNWADKCQPIAGTDLDFECN